MIRILIVDDQPGFRRHLRRLLAHAGLNVVGEAGSVSEAERLVEELRPDVAVVDVMLPGTNGLDGTRRLKALEPGIRVILTSNFHNQAKVFQNAAEEVGAESYIPKDELNLDVVSAWQALCQETGT